MTSSPRDVINSRYGIRLALWLGRVMPIGLGKRVVRMAADYISRHADWEMVRAVRANRWVVSGETLQGQALDQAVQATFRHTANSIFMFYHHLNDLEAMRSMIIDCDHSLEQLIQRPLYESRGVVVVAAHMGNYELIGQVAAMLAFKAMVLTLPDLTGGYKLQYENRRKMGVNLVPASMSSIRQAVDHLRAGGMALTGIDYPEKSLNYRPLFFNRPSALPVHHIVLALRANVPIRFINIFLNSEGKYEVSFSDPIEMVHCADHRQEINSNAEAVLKVAEGYIRQAPDQWMMTFPVWPEALEQVPG